MSKAQARKSVALRSGDWSAPAIVDSFRKLDPRTLVRNPVMFVVEIVSRGDHDHLLSATSSRGALGDAAFTGQIAAWLWFTVLFANFAEAIAEGRGKAQADTLRKTRTRDDGHARCERSTMSTGNAFRPRSSGASDLVLVVGGRHHSRRRRRRSKASPRWTNRRSPASRRR